MNRAPSSMTSRSTRRIIDSGSAPEGDAWAADDQIAGVSDEGDARSRVLANAGNGTRTLSRSAANRQFWIGCRAWLAERSGPRRAQHGCESRQRVATSRSGTSRSLASRSWVMIIRATTHTVAADLATHRVFFPLPTGPRSVRVSVVNVGRVLVLVLDTIVPVRM